MSEPTIDFPSRPATEQASPNLPGIQSAYLGPANSASATASGGGGGGGNVVTTSFPGSPVDGEAFMLTDNTASPTWYQQFQYNSTAGIWLGVGPARGTSLPGSPVEGMQAILTDSINSPTWNWHLWYSTGAAAWLFIGGNPLVASDLTNTSRAIAGAGYATYTSAPSITVPRAGSYSVTVRGRIIMGTNNCSLALSYAVGATGPSDNDAIILTAPLASGSITVSGAAGPSLKTGLAASTVIACQSKAPTGSGSVANSVLEVWPHSVT